MESFHFISFLFFYLTRICLIFILIKLISCLKNDLNIDQWIKKRKNLFWKRSLKIFSFFKHLFHSFIYPDEICSIIRIKLRRLFGKDFFNNFFRFGVEKNDLDFCYSILNDVSRSFSFVIKELPEELKDSVCIFYLVLRALDTIEDDINYPIEKKRILLKTFHEKLLIDNWSMNNIGDRKNDQILLNHFNQITNVLKNLDQKYQKVIIDITKKMGNGMENYLENISSIEKIVDYNFYCHYVAGLVGQGLSQMFSLSGLEHSHLYLQENISNSMGLFLQKTNIIRDYFEDIQAGRKWWPKEIWINYVDDLSHFKDKPNDQRSVQCLNHMIIDALNHIPDILNYLAQLQNEKIFRFCSIPQVMAIATLAQIYNNSLVFKSIIKIRKGLSCQIILNTSNLDQVHYWFKLFITQIEEKIRNETKIKNIHMDYQIFQRIRELCH